MRTTSAHADEGMWLFNKLPLDRMESATGFRPSQEWITHLQEASVKVGPGGSGSFVSPSGLLLTNHHVARSCLSRLSTPERDLDAQGFYAATQEEELQCPGLEVQALQQIVDVTAEVTANTGGLSLVDQNRVRRERSIQLEQDWSKRTGLRCSIVTLYGGAEYHLYQYRRFDDVRLVLAPEAALGNFGGDIDNFEYPRYALDVTFLRAYENGRPAHTPSFLKLDPSAGSAGEAVFVSGHPGRTLRHITLSNLNFLREVSFPYLLGQAVSGESALRSYAQSSPEAARRSAGTLYGFMNTRKRMEALIQGLNDPARMGRRQQNELDFKEKLKALPEGPEWLAAFDKVEAAQKAHATLYTRYQVLEAALQRYPGRLLSFARVLVRWPHELSLPNEKRLSEFSEANLASQKLFLLSTDPIHEDMEQVLVEVWLKQVERALGPNDPLLKQILKGHSIQKTAAYLVRHSKLASPVYRQAVLQEGQGGLDRSHDALIQLLTLLDAPARDVRKQYEDQVESVERVAYAELTRARWKIYGGEQFPDATGTLRLSYGFISGYVQDGVSLEHQTHLGGLFTRWREKGGKEPFTLPPRWRELESTLNLETPFDFVATSDTTGGSSGSPVVTVRGELVGVNFDSNRYKIANDLIYSSEGARNICVHIASVLESLKVVFGATRVLDELEIVHR